MDLDSFGTVAEVGVALAGFSAIATVLSFDRGAIAPLDRFRTLCLLMSALCAVFSSTIPMIGDAFGVSGVPLWRATSLVLLLVVFASTAAALFLIRELSAEDRNALSWSLSVFSVGGNVVVVGVQLINALGLLAPPGPGPIMASLVWLLFLSAVLFVRMLVNRPRRPAS